MLAEENAQLKEQIASMENAKEDVKLQVLQLEGLNKQKIADLQSEVNQLVEELSNKD